MQPRYFAFVQMAVHDEPRSHHFIGFPVTDGIQEHRRDTLPIARVVVIEQEVDGSATVNRYAADGGFGGDTWHSSLEEAIDQVRFEFGKGLGALQLIPDSVNDAKEYALTQVPNP